MGAAVSDCVDRNCSTDACFRREPKDNEESPEPLPKLLTPSGSSKLPWPPPRSLSPGAMEPEMRAIPKLPQRGQASEESLFSQSTTESVGDVAVTPASIRRQWQQRDGSSKGAAVSSTPQKSCTPGGTISNSSSSSKSAWQRGDQGQWVLPGQHASQRQPSFPKTEEEEAEGVVVIASTPADEAAGPEVVTSSASTQCNNNIEMVKTILDQLKGASPELREKLLQRLFKLGGKEALEAASLHCSGGWSPAKG